MSLPDNQLNEYTTYSYHHMLLVCDSPATATALSESSHTDLRRSASARKYDLRSVNNNPLAGNFITIIDGATDTEFVIQSASWESVVSPEPDASAHSMSTVGQMVVLEPAGINFLNVLVQAGNSLRVDSGNQVFLLKTIFVGNKPNGDTETISYTKPFVFTITDINAIIDHIQTSYTIEMVSTVNGYGNLPQAQQILSGLSLTLDPGASMKSTMKKLEDTINSNYTKLYDKFKSDAKCTKNNSDFVGDYIPVQYRIVLDEEYESYPSGDNPSVKSSSTGGTDVVIVAAPSVTFVELLGQVMRTSNRVIQDSIPDRVKKVPSIQSTFTREKDGPIVITYYVRQYKAEYEVISKGATTTTFEPEAGGIVFDYIFTGKSVDILEFDIHMKQGLTFFQTLQTSSDLGSSMDYNETHASAKAVEVRSPTKTTNLDTQTAFKVPLFLGGTIQDPRYKNTRNDVATGTYLSMMERQAHIESMGVSLKIRGNVQLLNESSKDVKEMDSPIETLGVLETSPTNDQTLIIPDISRVPAYAKININMPTTDVNSNTFAEPFWYQGWYQIASITHTFVDGLFTQDLILFAMATTVEGSADNDTECSQSPTPLFDQTTPLPNPQTVPVEDVSINTTPTTPEDDELRINQKASAIKAGSEVSNVIVGYTISDVTTTRVANKSSQLQNARVRVTEDGCDENSTNSRCRPKKVR